MYTINYLAPDANIIKRKFIIMGCNLANEGGFLVSTNFSKNGKYDSKTQVSEDLPALSVNRIVQNIQNGDEQLRNIFIESYEPFIAKTVSKTVGGCIVPKDSEAFSVGLSAFNEAIDKFDEQKYFVFLSFSEQVIRRRVIDHIRSNSKESKVLPFTFFEENKAEFEEKYLATGSDDGFEEVEYKEEIDSFEELLKQFDITVEELTECSPKHKDARQSSIRIAKLLEQNEDLFNKMLKKGKIPYKELEKVAAVNKRTIQRNSKFIIAVAIIFKFKFEIFKSYISEYDEQSL
jgi:RNA polymerase sigma factor